MHIDTYTFGLIMAGFGNVRSTDALQYLALAYTDLARPEDAEKTFARLREEHPESRFTHKIPSKG